MDLVKSMESCREPRFVLKGSIRGPIRGPTRWYKGFRVFGFGDIKIVKKGLGLRGGGLGFRVLGFWVFFGI